MTQETQTLTPQHLLFSHPFDYSTDQVMDWLLHYKQSIHRINSSNELMEFEDIEWSNKKEEEKKAYNYRSIWFRKVSELIRGNTMEEEHLADASWRETLSYFNETIDKEWSNVHDYFHRKFKSDKQLSRYFPRPLNKLMVLEKAQHLGMDIPKTLITRQKSSLLAFYKKNSKGIINKSISDHLMFANPNDPSQALVNYTEEINEAFIEALPQKFGLSLFQEKLDKRYEIRSFYLDGQCYSMAIFSQGSNQTQLDFRRYNDKRPNRRTAYQLDKKVSQQIDQLMKALNLNTGSLDLVKTKEGRCVFLEVNPSGQFGMTSYPCNYYLNKLIAEFLIDHG